MKKLMFSLLFSALGYWLFKEYKRGELNNNFGRLIEAFKGAQKAWNDSADKSEGSDEADSTEGESLTSPQARKKEIPTTPAFNAARKSPGNGEEKDILTPRTFPVHS